MASSIHRRVLPSPRVFSSVVSPVQWEASTPSPAPQSLESTVNLFRLRSS
ncbi:hypothetical protein F2Q69_00048873 [Brassica cretica]|uniref:Uncharacterized protein n=1 Tax=Brassica cretica TaxID=69181 RepID=A0A8S9PQV3_BRACR|nr:hypothetical protein F2Q69_00048873 [Brassica cretica]